MNATHDSPDRDTGTGAPGSPSWITHELIEKTLAVWQRFYRERLTTADAVEMLMAVGRLYGVFRDAGQTKGAVEV